MITKEENSCHLRNDEDDILLMSYTVIFLQVLMTKTLLGGPRGKFSRNQGNTNEKRAHTGVGMKNEHAKKWQKDSRVITGENAEPSCSTWHQAAPMYLPSTSYTGESIKKVKLRMLN